MSYPGLVTDNRITEHVKEFCSINSIKYKVINESKRKTEFLFDTVSELKTVKEYAHRVTKVHTKYSKFRVKNSEDVDVESI